MEAKIKNLIEWDRTEFAIEEMKLIVKDKDTEIYNNLILLHSDLRHSKNLHANGVISDKDHSLKKNQINKSVLNFTDDIKKLGFFEPVNESVNNTKIDKKKWKILFICSNPNSTSKIDFDKETKEIRQMLRKFKDDFEITEVYNATNAILLKEIITEKPDILHISCHAIGNRPIGSRSIGRPIEEQEGIILTNENNDIDLIPFDIIANQIRLFKDNMKCVVINACYTEPLALLVSTFIPYTIGHRTALGNDSVIDFARYFYEGLAFNKNIEEAYNYSSCLIASNYPQEQDNFVLYKQYS